MQAEPFREKIQELLKARKEAQEEKKKKKKPEQEAESSKAEGAAETAEKNSEEKSQGQAMQHSETPMDHSGLESSEQPQSPNKDWDRPQEDGRKSFGHTEAGAQASGDDTDALGKPEKKKGFFGKRYTKENRNGMFPKKTWMLL